MSAPGAVKAWGGRLGIRQRVYLLMAVGIAFPLGLMATVGWYWLHTLDERLLSGRVAAVTAVAAHFDQELTGDLELLQRLAASVGPHLGQGKPEVEEKAVREAFAHFRHREAVFLLDLERRVLAERTRHCVPVHRWQLNVEEDQRRGEAARRLDAARPVGHGVHGVPVLLEQEGEQVPVLFVVFDDEDGWAHATLGRFIGSTTVKVLPAPAVLSA